jgi:serine/threonine protein kinase
VAPEVIQENKYNGKADVWSLGITAIELAEGKVPLSGIHPLRAMFQIPNKAPPTLTEKEKWSDEFNDFIAQCLTKSPEDRPTSKVLLKVSHLLHFLTYIKHPFIKKAKNPKILMELIDKLNNKIQEAGGRANLMKTLNKKGSKKDGSDDEDGSDSDDYNKKGSDDEDGSDDDSDSGTMVRKKNESDGSDGDDSDSGTMVRKKNKDDGSGGSDGDDSDSGTMVRKKNKKKDDSDDEEVSGTSTLVVKKKKPTKNDSDEESGTLVVKKKSYDSDSGDEHGAVVSIPVSKDVGSGSDNDEVVITNPKQVNLGSDDEIESKDETNQDDYYSKWNKELLQQQLAMLEEEYQKELSEIQERYSKKKENIKKALSKMK